jgi:dTDP-4-dehydrorhamnose 3,5-epimerase
MRTPRFECESTPINGVVVLRRSAVADERGSFGRMFCVDELRSIPFRGVNQINLSRTVGRGTVRGMHYQTSPDAESKIVSCLRGHVWDVAVDLRHGSATFLQWFGVELSEGNQTSLVIPTGCAHGFQTLSDEAQLLYLHDQAWSPESDRGVNPCDPAVRIGWPEPISRMSEKDRTRALLESRYQGEKP